MSVLKLPFQQLTSKEEVHLAELEKVIDQGFGTFYEVGKALQEIRDKRLYRKEFKTFEEYCRKRWELARATAYQKIEASGVMDNLSAIADKPANEWIARPLVPLSQKEQQKAWRLSLKAAPEGRPTAQIVRTIAAKIISERNGSSLPALKDRGLFIPSLDQIEKLRTSSTATFNNQGSNENIEWARWSWNPVTGCLHGCDFCYARDIANRFYEQGFDPTFLPERLAAPRNTKVPENAATDLGWKNVFVCSMADLWGKWVPRIIIDLVLNEVREFDQWNYLFLTKFPARYEEFAGELPPNAWMGTTVCRQADVERAEKAFKKLVDAGHRGVRWLSIEPMYERIEFHELSLFDWIVVGGASQSSQTPSFVPPIEWYLHLYEQAVLAKCQFYMKSNIRFREYPNYF